MFSLRTHAIICVAFFAALIVIAIGGNANLPAGPTALSAEKWIVYAIWVLMAADLVLALTAAIRVGLFDQSDSKGAASTSGPSP